MPQRRHRGKRPNTAEKAMAAEDGASAPSSPAEPTEPAAARAPRSRRSPNKEAKGEANGEAKGEAKETKGRRGQRRVGKAKVEADGSVSISFGPGPLGLHFEGEDDTVFIKHVLPDRQAHGKGLEEGMRLVQVGGAPVTSFDDAMTAIKTRPRPVELKFLSVALSAASVVTAPGTPASKSSRADVSPIRTPASAARNVTTLTVPGAEHTVSFGKGPLGINFETVPGSPAVVVADVDPTGLAGKLTPDQGRVAVGAEVVAVGNRRVEGQGFSRVLRFIRSSARPLRITFREAATTEQPEPSPQPELELDTEEAEVDVEFGPGPIGLHLETDFYSSDTIVKGTDSGANAARQFAELDISAGHVLVAVNGESVEGQGFAAAMEAVRAGAKKRTYRFPLVLRFREPVTHYRAVRDREEAAEQLLRDRAAAEKAMEVREVQGRQLVLFEEENAELKRQVSALEQQLAEEEEAHAQCRELLESTVEAIKQLQAC